MALPAPYKVEMTVKKQITINAGVTTTTEIPIPSDTEAALKGYGYTYYVTNTFQLVCDEIQFPARSDQEGSASIPRIFEQAIRAKPGSSVSLTITNGDSSNHTYDLVFYFYLSKMFPNTATYQSSGGELILATGSGSGTGNTVAIYNSSFTTAANVTANGVEVDPQAPSTMLQGTATAGAAGAALAASTACKKVTLHTKITASKDADGYSILIGNSAGQEFPLLAGAYMDVEIDDLAKIYVKRAGSSNVTVYYTGA